MPHRAIPLEKDNLIILKQENLVIHPRHAPSQSMGMGPFPYLSAIDLASKEYAVGALPYWFVAQRPQFASHKPPLSHRRPDAQWLYIQ